MNLRASLANLLLPKNYHLTRLFYTTAFGVRSRGKTPLLVYQMGKVGSSTIAATLKTMPLAMPVFHIHSLTQASILAHERFYFGNDQRFFRPAGWPNTVHLFTSYYLQKQLQKRNQGRWKVITLVREPVARNISGFFETIEYLIPNFYARLNNGELPISALTEFFLTQYENHDIPLHWFDDEMKQTLGVDVFAQPFSTKKGYAIYQSAKADVLLLRLESLSHCYAKAFEQFLGLKDIELVNANDARDKAYYPTYQQFVKSVALPEAYLQRMYDSKYMLHFYNSAEIERLWAKWQSDQR